MNTRNWDANIHTLEHNIAWTYAIISLKKRKDINLIISIYLIFLDKVVT